MVTRARRALSIGLLLPCASVSCAAVLGFERLSDDGTTPETGVPDGSGDAPASDAEAGVDAGACGEIGIGDRPPNDGGAEDAQTVTFAVDLFDLGIDTGKGPAGFNLDRTCTTSIDTSSCVTSAPPGSFESYVKDFSDEGGDNAGYALLQFLADKGDAFKPVEINKRLHAGEFGIVIRVSRWNGTADDPDVFVEVFPAIGAWKKLDGGALVDGGTPTFTATDEWMRDSRFQLAGGLDSSSVNSAVAWVTKGKLVATFDFITLAVSVPDDDKPLDLVVHEGYLAGSLVTDGGAYLADAVAGGRWKTSDFLDQVRQIHVVNALGVTSAYLCDPGTINIAYAAVKNETCRGRDIRSTARDDGAKLPCDSISLGMRVQTYPVLKPGAFATAPPHAVRCVDAAVPAGDDCAP
jgi:hypothetical protein